MAYLIDLTTFTDARGNLTVIERSITLSLPISFSHSEKEIDYVCQMINSFIF